MRATHDKDKAGSDTRRCPMQTAAQADGCGSEIRSMASMSWMENGCGSPP